MILHRIQRIFRRGPWIWRQPLTLSPTLSGMPISDLFVWRKSPEWQTFFELIDISALFEDDDSCSRHVTVVFFDVEGRQILSQRVDLRANCRQTLDISAMLGKQSGEFGTFAVFHSTTPEVIVNLGSFLTERGYVSYRYSSAPLRAYVHGNFDAVARRADGGLELLGGTSFLQRKYSLQHELKDAVTYELGLVNPSGVAQRCTFKLISLLNAKATVVQVAIVPPGGIELVVLPVDKIGSTRLIIESRLVMARPVVFRIENLKLDVFHG